MFGAAVAAAAAAKKDEAEAEAEADEDQPPKVEVTTVVEDDAVHSVRHVGYPDEILAGIFSQAFLYIVKPLPGKTCGHLNVGDHIHVFQVLLGAQCSSRIVATLGPS